MSYWSLVLLAGVGLALLIVVTHLIIGRYTKRRFWKSFAIAHILFMIIASLIYFPGEKDAQHQLFWLIPGAVDLPFSLLLFLFTTKNLLISVLILAMLGTLQYTIIGWLIDLALTKPRKPLIPSKKILVAFLALVMVFSVLGYRKYLYNNLPESEKAEIELNDADPAMGRSYNLERAARASFDEKKYQQAKKYANELLVYSEKYPDDWNYGNAVYSAHIVLGRLALLDNDVETANKELFLAVQTPGSSQLDTFGPNMMLAKDLLGSGQKESVIRFLIECKRFWEDHEKIDQWIEVIEAGEMPDFGANLGF